MKYIQKIKKFTLTNKKPMIGLGGLLFLIIGFVLSQGSSDNYSKNNYYGGGDRVELSAIASADYAVEESFEPVVSRKISAPRLESGEAPYDEQQSRKLVKNGSLSLVVRDIEVTRAKLAQLISQQKGFISSENFSQSSNYNNENYQASKNGSLSIRIPNENFDTTVSAVRDLALVVNNEYTNTADVTEQYADLELRIENKLQEEAQYRTILKKASKVSDILEVTRYIEQARSDAERMQGQLNALDNKVTLATLEIYLESEKQYEIGGVSWSPVDNIKESYQGLVNGLTSVVDTLISFVIMLPLLLMYLAILWIGYRVARKIYKRLFN